MAEERDLLVVGGGKMGAALVDGLLSSGWAQPAQVTVTEILPGRRAELAAPTGLAGRHPGLQLLDGRLPPAHSAILAVKPADVEPVCRRLGAAGVRRLLSIAAGVTLKDLQAWCPEGCALVRAMPNMAALVRAGATAIAAGPSAGPVDLEWATGILRSVGTVVEVPERLLDAVTGLSGSGPAYVFLVAEAMTEAGVMSGLPRPVAAELVMHTLLGSARLLTETGESAEALRAAVTSPAGTTAAGIRQLEARGVRSAFIEAVAAAVQRSRELGSPGPAPAG
ncbi:MAG: pyrroline-5-carboxylate reductase [Acidimicrobiales bacterium]